jgi:hypothetical protein
VELKRTIQRVSVLTQGVNSIPPGEVVWALPTGGDVWPESLEVWVGVEDGPRQDVRVFTDGDILPVWAYHLISCLGHRDGDPVAFHVYGVGP